MNQYRKTPRANFLDYSAGKYFVTACTKDKRHYFGSIVNGEMRLSDIGRFVELQLNSVSAYCKGIEVPLFVVMPNHIHAIVCIKGENMPLEYVDGDLRQRSPNPALRANAASPRGVPVLSRFMSSFKGAVTKYAKSRNLDFGWQARYHDHYIRGNHDGNKISEYIMNNVARWQEDCFYKDEV